MRANFSNHLTWLIINFKQVFQVTIEHNSNSTNSILSFIPNIEDTGKFLKCRAENVEMTASQLEDSWSLQIDCNFLTSNIFWALTRLFTDLPRAVLRLGPTLNANKIKEGDDVYFECGVDAKPAIYKTSWWFNVSISIFTTKKKEFPIYTQKSNQSR